MLREHLVGALLVALFVSPTGKARAEKLFDISGHVALGDAQVPKGVKVRLQVDLDRNHKLDSFESVSGTVGSDGTYKLAYDLEPKDVDFEFVQFALKLVAAYQARGFEALLDKGPLPIVLSFQREGYSTVVKRFTTLTDPPSLDVVLAPLRDIQCLGEACLSSDGSVQISGFPGGTGIARAYAQAYDPKDETPRFPGSFTDDADNLLKSSGFAEINLHDASGAEIHKLSSPVSVRFEAKRASWHTLPDLEPKSGRIELPMYSFDRDIGEWVREEDGELEHEDGTKVGEDALDAIRQGTFEGRLFIAFRTAHFSTFNCDEPIEGRACVQGRIVNAKGKALPGIQISINGASYTGNAGPTFTGTDGRFAGDVMRSERATEDVDFNGKSGESFTARVVATGTGVFVGETFETPRVQGSVIESSSKSCRAPNCDCLDVGDIEVEFEEPRACEITIDTRFSGKHAIGSGGPLAKDDAVAGAKVRGVLTGELSLPQPAVAAVCQDNACNAGKASKGGTVTFIVPVVGDAPSIQIDADLLVQDGDTSHYYSGNLLVAGCKRGETKLAATLEVALDHAAMQGLDSFIDSLGAGPPSSDDPTDPLGLGGANNPVDAQDPLDCGCGIWQTRASNLWHGTSLLALAVGLVLRRRRARERGQRG